MRNGRDFKTGFTARVTRVALVGREPAHRAAEGQAVYRRQAGTQMRRIPWVPHRWFDGGSAAGRQDSPRMRGDLPREDERAPAKRVSWASGPSGSSGDSGSPRA